MEIGMINDKLMRFDELEAPYLDRGIFFGDGVYEVIRSYNGKIFALEDHLKRFSNSLNAIDITDIDINLVRHRVEKAFTEAGIPNAKIYFHVTRGSSARNHKWDEDLKSNFFLTVNNLNDKSEVKAQGIAVSTHPDWRWKRCDIKSLNLLANVLARQDASRNGCDEAILVDENGIITEGAGSCFFAVFGRTIQTAPLNANILPSITRKYVIIAAKNSGLEVLEESFTAEKAAAADELFIAVTTKDVVPVVKFDDKVIGDGKPGNVTKELIEEFRKFYQ
jgi:D-alanine transaminase